MVTGTTAYLSVGGTDGAVASGGHRWSKRRQTQVTHTRKTVTNLGSPDLEAVGCPGSMVLWVRLG